MLLLVDPLAQEEVRELRSERAGGASLAAP
jgi:hypothetical protein